MAQSTPSSLFLIATMAITFYLFFMLPSCSTEKQQEESSVTHEYAQIFDPIPAEAEAPEDNPMTEEKIDLGHMLFFENRLSRSGIISCNSCHVVGAAGVDHRDLAMGRSEERRVGKEWRSGRWLGHSQRVVR